MANWKLHKAYRGYILPMITERLNYLVRPLPLLTNHDVHSILKTITKVESHSKSDNKQFLIFLEEVFCIAAHLDLVIPDPNEYPYEQENTRTSRDNADIILSADQITCN